MNSIGFGSLAIIAATLITSWYGIKNRFFFENHKLEVEKILIYKEYKRLITSGFIHLNWSHLFFSLLALFFISFSLEAHLGALKLLIVYFVSMVGGSALALYLHRFHGQYSSAGASGAISGIMFATIALFPGLHISLFFLPIMMPAWLVGLIYVLISVYGISSKQGNIGHEAHLGGGLIGMITTLIMHPSALLQNYITILIITVPTIVFIYIIITKPHLLFVDNFYFKAQRHAYSADDVYNEEKQNNQLELDKILDKINKHGMASLSKKENEKLKEYSQTIR